MSDTCVCNIALRNCELPSFITLSVSTQISSLTDETTSCVFGSDFTVSDTGTVAIISRVVYIYLLFVSDLQEQTRSNPPSHREG